MICIHATLHCRIVKRRNILTADLIVLYFICTPGDDVALLPGSSSPTFRLPNVQKKKQAREQNYWLCTQHCYRNLLYFCCKKNFVQRKCTKIFYTNIILQRGFFHVGWLPATHKHFPNYCCPHVLVYVVPLTQQAISFSQAISSVRGAIFSINAHHTWLVKFCEKIILRKYILG